ncbi:methyl-galactoside transport system substrate-binding protein [Succinivibrio dextrinosolvens]|uniref:substrate-binding domain-containing protein n=1 Tax=Succinivibrio dextrinosolvens TaxID=83771 RepID=UPI0008ECAF5B|nr:substrate-binding domain-containing protein [Succinivibrio dextrinosolvens]SFS81704.1 methyl-galactoside transport system substrate-binding protein [Succinivibrio dextrinosolvens]
MKINALLKNLLILSLVFPFSSNAQNETNCFYISLKPEIIANTDVLIKNYGKSKNISFMTHDAKSNSLNQVFQIDNDFRFADSTIVITNDITSAQNVIDLSKKKKSPLIFSLIKPQVSFLSYPKAWFVGPNEAIAGHLQAEILHEYIKSKGSIDKNHNKTLDLVIMRGAKGNPDTISRTTSLMSGLIQHGYILSPMTENYANWDYDKAYKIMGIQIKKLGLNNIEAIAANNDEMALGALKAIQDEGYNKGEPDKFIPILGIGGDSAVLKAIEEKTITGTVVPDLDTMAKITIDLITEKGLTEQKIRDNYKVKVENRNVLVEYSAKKNF